MLNIKHIYKIEQHGESYSLNLEFNFKYQINYQVKLLKQTFTIIIINFYLNFLHWHFELKIILYT